MRDIEYRLRKVIRDESPLTAHDRHLAMKVNVDSNLIVAFNFDSLDSIELVMGVEDEFGILIPDEVAETFTTLQAAIDYLAEQGIPNQELQGIPDDQDPVVYLPVQREVAEERFVVVYENHLTLSGLDANLYADQNEAQTFAATLNGRSIDAEVFKLVKV